MISDEELIKQVLEIVEYGPRPLSTIADRLRGFDIGGSETITFADRLEIILDNSDYVWRSIRGLYYSTNNLLNNVCLSHVLTQQEIDSDLVHIFPDLDGIDFGLDEVLLTTGEALEVVFKGFDAIEQAEEEGSFLGPPDWLHQYSHGDLIVFQRSNNVLKVFTSTEIDSGQKEEQALIKTFRSLYEEGRGLEPMEILMEALCNNGTIFKQPVKPLSELIEHLLLERKGTSVGPLIEEWDKPSAVIMARKKNEIAENLRLDDCCVKEFDNSLFAYGSFQEGKHDEFTLRSALKSLSHGNVALAFATWTFQNEPDPFPAIDSFTTYLASTPGPNIAPPLYIRALSRTAQGHGKSAEQDLVLALGADPNYELALRELANIAADRGDISQHLKYLSKCTYDDIKEQIEEVQSLLPDYSSIEPTDICPCGSGFRFRNCCMDFPKLTPQARRAWMKHKIIGWMNRPEHTESLADFQVTFESDLQDSNTQDYEDLVQDIAIFEGGFLESYFEQKSELLSQEDQKLLERLTLTRRSLYEVTHLEQNKSLELRDLITGETITLTSQMAPLQAFVGDYLLARVLDDEEGQVIIGEQMLISLRQRDSLLELLRYEPNAFDLIAWIAKAVKPPELVNFSGEKIVFCTCKVRPSNLQNAISKLMETFEEKEPKRWIATEQDPNGGIITMMFSLRDGLIVVETNSRLRMFTALDILDDAIGTYDIVDSHETSAKSTSEHYTGMLDVSSSLNLTQDIQIAIEEHIEERENRWLDESIPALGGLSPRQALNDPTRKDDLIRLLNEFERNEEKIRQSTRSFSGFKAGRIKKKLGI